MPKVASELPEARVEAGNRFSLTDLRRNQIGQRVNFGLLVSPTVRQYLSVVPASQLGLWYFVIQPWRTNKASWTHP